MQEYVINVAIHAVCTAVIAALYMGLSWFVFRGEDFELSHVVFGALLMAGIGHVFGRLAEAILWPPIKYIWCRS
jgi:hypothetical protein